MIGNRLSIYGIFPISDAYKKPGNGAVLFLVFFIVPILLFGDSVFQWQVCICC
jgi:hypothetical protein